jgi:hypothetical protein
MRSEWLFESVRSSAPPSGYGSVRDIVYEEDGEGNEARSGKNTYNTEDTAYGSTIENDSQPQPADEPVKVCYFAVDLMEQVLFRQPAGLLLTPQYKRLHDSAVIDTCGLYP